ncbi:hypothetical protein MSG28_014102 [Choristoneura fumiferana]|uniref:Uncharacterized protein n=1 Tax=Choristoneura fumiferana TaxID=7141 RepID=A0ACC0JG14_CHOFU|nr:hypothetical protein MSG28_014102 [Choristoneura fumiferana]
MVLRALLQDHMHTHVAAHAAGGGGLERVAEELMGRRKWKLYQDAILPKRDGEPSSDDSMPSTDPPPALKIKTIEQINEDKQEEKRPETILESLIKRPATVPKVEMVEEPTDWKPSDKCYFCVEGEGGGETRPTGAQTSNIFDMSPAKKVKNRCNTL